MSNKMDKILGTGQIIGSLIIFLVLATSGNSIGEEIAVGKSLSR